MNAARYGSPASNKRVGPVDELKTVIEAEKKKQIKTELIDDNASRRNSTNRNSTDRNSLIRNTANSQTGLILSDQKYYRANLLGEIVNKMRGADDHINPGHYVEYYA